MARPYQAPPYHPPQPVKQKPLAPWVLLSTLIGGVIAAIGANTTPRPSMEGSTAYMIGGWIGSTLAVAVMALVVAALVALVMLIFARPFRRSLGRAYCFAVVIIALLSMSGNFLGSMMVRKREAQQAKVEKTKEALQGMQDDLDQVIAESSKEGNSRNTDFRLETETPTDAASSLRHLVRSMLNDSLAVQNEYTLAIEEAGLPKLLNGDRLAADMDEDFKESRAILKRCEGLIENSRKKAKELLDGLPQRLDRYPLLSKADKAEVLRGHNDGKARKIRALDASWDLEAEALGILGKVVDFLELSQEDWSVRNGKIVFDNHEDLVEFQTLVKKVAECAERQKALQAKSIEEAKSKLGGLQEGLDK